MSFSNFSCFAAALVSTARLFAGDATEISRERMQAIYDEVKTPFKFGIVLEPPAGKKVDCPNVFRHAGKWFMVYAQFENEPQGYTTQLASSDDLRHWKPLG